MGTASRAATAKGRVCGPAATGRGRTAKQAGYFGNKGLATIGPTSFYKGTGCRPSLGTSRAGLHFRSQTGSPGPGSGCRRRAAGCHTAGRQKTQGGWRPSRLFAKRPVEVKAEIGTRLCAGRSPKGVASTVLFRRPGGRGHITDGTAIAPVKRSNT